MNSGVTKKKRYLFMFPSPAMPNLEGIESGSIPRERLVGYYELKVRGWDVAISDARWVGFFSEIRRKLKGVFHLPSISMLRDWTNADVIVVKDSFSLALTLMARLMGKKIVYLDCMFKLPAHPLKKLQIKLNVKLSAKVICFSSTQADLWSEALALPRDKIVALDYTMDCAFYPRVCELTTGTASAVSIGRDMGRDFSTLATAFEGGAAKVVIVTLPYLIPESAKTNPNVEIRQRLSYEELFKLYRSARVMVIPLKAGITYPSGIRAVMEAMLIGIPVVATRTPVLEEYFSDGEELFFVESGDPLAIEGAVSRLINDDDLARSMAKKARKKMEEKYPINAYADRLEKVLAEV